MRIIVPISATRRDVQTTGFAPPRLLALAAGLLILASSAPMAAVRAADVTGDAPDGGIRPTIQYEEALAHAGDKIAFRAGDRVTVPFKPRKTDRWAVGGGQPKALPAGRLTGKAMRLPGAAPAPESLPPAEPAAAAMGPVDASYVAADPTTSFDLAAAVDPGGLKREVFGFLPYWELSDSSTRLDWEKLSTIAYFGVGAAANGDLQKRNTDGSTTVGWSGWTSAKLTSVINAAHASGARVVLTVQSFAWTSAWATRQKALLGSPANRANLARQIAAAVRNRGADGVNLDFEPIVATYANEFTALIRKVRAELNRVSRGYQLTFDATGKIGNYPVEAATAAGGADAVMIMGYDYRAGSSNPVGSVAPLGGPAYDITDTIASYVHRVPASKIILGVPYYGRAWSTDSAALHAGNISGTKNGTSTTVVYGTAAQFAADHGRKWDPVEGVAWTSYRRKNCTAAYGCVNPWRQLYYDDAKALGLKYDLINRYNLRGAGIWALGYDGTRPELYQTLKAKFITDTVPPRITGSSLTSPIISPNGDGRSDKTTVRVAVTGLIRFGWVVEPFFDGIAGQQIRSGSMVGKNVAYQWDGRTHAGAVVPDGPYRITIWTADASNNRASVQKIVTVDRRPAAMNLASKPASISPNGDGDSDRTTLSMRADSAISGSARLIARNGASVRKWTFKGATTGSWVWDGKNSAGRTVGDGRYILRVGGFDRAGNPTVRALTVAVDRTIRRVSWSRASFLARARQTSHVSFTLSRAASITIAIYSGPTVVRRIWQDRVLSAGSHGWTWNGRTATGVLLRPGTYRAVVTARSGISSSTLSRNVIVRAR
jgi:spore germination protein YaaH/flagellar hook assembly protein FlgD